MDLTFRKVKYGKNSPTTGKCVAYLVENNWDDYSFKTTFFLTVFDEYGKQHEIGSLKIGCVGFEKGWVSRKISRCFLAIL